jgi:uncharacterized membrane protein HdeD (DUF308 family)
MRCSAERARRAARRKADPMVIASNEHGQSLYPESERTSYPWWTFLLRGLAAVAFGVLTLIAPGPSLLVLVLAWGVFAFVDGALLIAHALRRHTGDAPGWVLGLQGLVGIAAGITTFVVPGLTAIALLLLIAGWCLATGVLEIVQAVRLRKVIRGEWLLALRGLVTILLGVVLMVAPGAGALALVLYIGSFAIALGVLLIALSVRARPRRPHSSAPRFAHT